MVYREHGANASLINVIKMNGSSLIVPDERAIKRTATLMQQSPALRQPLTTKQTKNKGREESALREWCCEC